MHWKFTFDVKGFSWNKICQYRTIIFKSACYLKLNKYEINFKKKSIMANANTAALAVYAGKKTTGPFFLYLDLFIYLFYFNGGDASPR